MNRCKKCGTSLPDEAKFCNICGTPVEAVAQPVVENVAAEATQPVVENATAEATQPVVENTTEPVQEADGNIAGAAAAGATAYQTGTQFDNNAQFNNGAQFNNNAQFN
ncbi:MAG: zinc-ribbon domain-containing protein, partial [Roseburia sp.]